MDKHDVAFEYDQITDNIFIGTNMCCQVHFEQELLDKGINIDISLEEERLDAPFGVESFLWLPTKDLTPPSQDQLDMGVKAIDSYISLNKKMYVHCRLGHGRGPTMVAAYLISTGMTLEDAIETIRKKDFVVIPDKKPIMIIFAIILRPISSANLVAGIA